MDEEEEQPCQVDLYWVRGRLVDDDGFEYTDWEG
jgi:hypothetical protein